MTDVWKWIAISAVGFAAGGGMATMVGADKTTKEEVDTQIKLQLAPIVTEQKLIRKEIDQLEKSLEREADSIEKKLDQLLERE